MKTTIIILWILFIFAIIIEADVGQKTFKSYVPISVGTICIKGYLFAHTHDGRGLAQIFAVSGSKININPPQPMRCK